MQRPGAKAGAAEPNCAGPWGTRTFSFYHATSQKATPRGAPLQAQTPSSFGSPMWQHPAQRYNKPAGTAQPDPSSWEGFEHGSQGCPQHNPTTHSGMIPISQMSHTSKSQTRSPPSGPCSSLPHTAGKAVALPKITESAAQRALPITSYMTLRRSGSSSDLSPPRLFKKKNKNTKLITHRCSSCAQHTDVGPRV